jgi:hypothetical protein
MRFIGGGVVYSEPEGLDLSDCGPIIADGQHAAATTKFVRSLATGNTTVAPTFLSPSMEERMQMRGDLYGRPF